LVDTDRRIIDHGDIITAGGFLSWVDLGLLLIERILAETVGVETARFVLPIEPRVSRAIFPALLRPRRTEIKLCLRLRSGCT